MQRTATTLWFAAAHVAAAAHGPAVLWIMTMDSAGTTRRSVAGVRSRLLRWICATAHQPALLLSFVTRVFKTAYLRMGGGRWHGCLRDGRGAAAARARMYSA